MHVVKIIQKNLHLTNLISFLRTIKTSLAIPKNVASEFDDVEMVNYLYLLKTTNYSMKFFYFACIFCCTFA